jgi:hypothetical protein
MAAYAVSDRATVMDIDDLTLESGLLTTSYADPTLESGGVVSGCSAITH